jgi:hypothetical protein
LSAATDASNAARVAGISASASAARAAVSCCSASGPDGDGERARREEEEGEVVEKRKRTRRRHLRDDSAEEMGVSLRSHFAKYPRRMWDRAKIAADIRIEVKGPAEVMLEAMERLSEQDLDASEDSVAEELGYECAELLFRVFTPAEFAEAKARFEGRAVAEAPRRQGKSKDTGQIGRRFAFLQDRAHPTSSS